MAVTRRDLGNIIQGFGGGFFPVKFQQERIQRQKLSDRQNFLTRIGEQIREGFLTEEQLIPHAKALEQEYGDTPEQALTSLRQYLPTESQRGSEIRRRLGDDPRLWTRELAGAIAGDVGRPEYFQARRALPSTSIVGGYDPETGALSTRPEPLTSTQTIGAGFDPSDRSYDPRLRDVRTTGKMFAPLVAQPQAERPFVPGATGGTPLEWGGPQADIFEGIQKEAILKESEQEARLREYRGEDLRETLGITEEMHRKFFPRQLEDQILEIEALAPVKRQEMLEDLREENAVRRADDRMRLEGPYAKAVEEQHERLAIISAYVNDRPEWIERRNPQTGEPVIYAVTRDWKTGQLRFSDVTGSFGGTELWYGGTSPRGMLGLSLGEEAHLMSSVVTGLSSEGKNADPRSQEGQENILKAAKDIGLNPGFVLQWMESVKGQLNEPPGVRGGEVERGGAVERDAAVEQIYGSEPVVEELTQLPGETGGAYRSRLTAQRGLALAQSDWIPDTERKMEAIVKILRGTSPGTPEFEIRNKQYNDLLDNLQKLRSIVESGVFPKGLIPLTTSTTRFQDPRNPFESTLRLRP